VGYPVVAGVCLFWAVENEDPNAPLVSNLAGKEIEEGQREREGFNGTQSALFFFSLLTL